MKFNCIFVIMGNFVGDQSHRNEYVISIDSLAHSSTSVGFIANSDFCNLNYEHLFLVSVTTTRGEALNEVPVATTMNHNV